MTLHVLVETKNSGHVVSQAVCAASALTLDRVLETNSLNRDAQDSRLRRSVPPTTMTAEGARASAALPCPTNLDGQFGLETNDLFSASSSRTKSYRPLSLARKYCELTFVNFCRLIVILDPSE
jgi:hypothetical protein